jgi:cephalosporin hydroxylase
MSRWRALAGRQEQTPAPAESDDERRTRIVDDFAVLYYGEGAGGGTWNRMAWLGNPLLKNPLDLWIYQEIVASTKPDLIIETGTFCGGSALYLAGLCDLLGRGEVISVDVAPEQTPEHPRVTYLTGSSVADDIVATMRARAEGKRTMVILDSDHRAPHVSAELDVLSPLVSEGCYLVVEDTNVNGHPVLPDFGPGPTEAMEGFLPDHPEFTPDRELEKFLFTFNPGGYLRRGPEA